MVWENKLHLFANTENILVVLDLTGQKQRFWRTNQSDHLVFPAKKIENKKQNPPNFCNLMLNFV